MRPLALALALTSLAAIAAAQKDTSALVDASKEAKSKRKTSTTKVITNADVKKAKAKLVENPGKAAAAEPKKQPTLLEKQATERAARVAAEEKLAAAEKRVAELEKELAKLEQQYFAENDLDRRDQVIAKQFADVKAKLDEARNAAVSAAEQASSRRQGGETPPVQPAGTPALPNQ